MRYTVILIAALLAGCAGGYGEPCKFGHFSMFPLCDIGGGIEDLNNYYAPGMSEAREATKNVPPCAEYGIDGYCKRYMEAPSGSHEDGRQIQER